jgi:hypothetical protein
MTQEGAGSEGAGSAVAEAAEAEPVTRSAAREATAVAARQTERRKIRFRFRMGDRLLKDRPFHEHSNRRKRLVCSIVEAFAAGHGGRNPLVALPVR